MPEYGEKEYTEEGPQCPSHSNPDATDFFALLPLKRSSEVGHSVTAPDVQKARDTRNHAAVERALEQDLKLGSIPRPTYSIRRLIPHIIVVHHPRIKSHKQHFNQKCETDQRRT